MNIHIPERQENETFEAYKIRRAHSHAAAKSLKRMPVSNWPNHRARHGKSALRRIKQMARYQRLLNEIGSLEIQ